MARVRYASLESVSSATPRLSVRWSSKAMRNRRWWMAFEQLSTHRPLEDLLMPFQRRVLDEMFNGMGIPTRLLRDDQD